MFITWPRRIQILKRKYTITYRFSVTSVLGFWHFQRFYYILLESANA